MGNGTPAGGAPQTKSTPAATISLRVFVRSPGGRPIDKAEVKLLNPAKTAESTADGVAIITMREDEFDALPERERADGVKVKDVSFEASKSHHGPQVSAKQVYKDGAVSADTELARATKGYAPNAPHVETRAGKRELNLVLVEGGQLGKLFDNSGGYVRLRRLSSEQVQQELVYALAHGEVALAKAWEPTFTHDLSEPTCTDKCKITGPNVTTARVTLTSNTICGVEFLSVLGWDGSKSKFIEWNAMSLGWQPLHQRLLVGVARLCRDLGQTYGAKAIFSQGFRTEAGDAHTDGRAFDLAGVACAPVTSKPHDIRDGVDFIVAYHRGQLHMLVQLSGQPTRTRLNTQKNTTQYYDQDKSPTIGDRICYRLQEIPTPDQRMTASKDVSDAHLQKARDAFQHIYDFCSSEFTHRRTEVGPLGGPDTMDPTVRAKLETEDASAPQPLGAETGNLFHPDVPKSSTGSSGREAHYNHFHIQIGPIQKGPQVP